MSKQAYVTLAVVGTVACAAVFALQASEAPSTQLFGQSSEFVQYLAKHGKSYQTKEEFLFREKLYNAKKITHAKINSQNGNTFTVGPNKFSDWTEAEYKTMLGHRPLPDNGTYKTFGASNVQDGERDWRNDGAVTGVKD